ncbi:MAG: ATP-dependent protease LonB [Euryarchaeota archaeon]|nr:ATP-dependent protease LonB [Euryarchaeota archaeon]
MEKNAREELPPVDEWIESVDIKSTADVKIPKRLIDQVIGQDHAVEIIKKAALQRRHVLLIGEPGTGKSMMAKAMAELLPREELEDVLCYYNPEDPLNPKIRVVPAGKGREIVEQEKKREMLELQSRMSSLNTFIFAIVLLMLGLVIANALVGGGTIDITALIMIIFFVFFFYLLMRGNPQMMPKPKYPKLLVSHNPGDPAPFVDATGFKAGALLGDVRHDPFQSGGLETPPNHLVEPGAIHLAHKGVLFIDEIGTLDIETQIKLLTAMQEKKFPITGQSERSFGSMIKTDPVPCDFILVAAGNFETVRNMHPALRSRIRGYGYEVVVNHEMPDTHENRLKVIRFIAQEVAKDGKIPHFDKEAIAEIIKEAQRMSGRRGYLTLRLRELGGLVRVAGDVARSKGHRLVTKDDVIEAKKLFRTLEGQIADRYMAMKKEYMEIITSGYRVGRVNGLAILGGGDLHDYVGIILPIEAEVTPSLSKEEGRIIATGKLGDIAKEAVQNVSALFKKYSNKDLSTMDIHIQFIGTYEGVEGDSASISIATAVISALEGIPVDQSVAMTGSLSVRGEVLPVGGIAAKIEAAVNNGIKKILIPYGNYKDIGVVRIPSDVKIVPVRTLYDVLKEALAETPEKKALLERFMGIVKEVVPHERKPIAEEI